MVIGLVVVGMGFIGSSSGSGPQTCDMTGSVTGTVTDVAILPIFTGWNVNLSTGNCHDTTIFTQISSFFHSISVALSGGALIQVGGPYHIQVKVYDDRSHLLGVSECFSFTTNAGEVTKSFSYPISFSDLTKGQSIIVNTYTQCDSSGASVQATFPKTV